MTTELPSSVVFLAAQAAGVLLVSTLLLLLARETGRRFVWRWVGAWCCLVVALCALLSVLLEYGAAIGLWAYMYGEFAFAITLRRGLREYWGDAGSRWSDTLALVVAGAAAATIVVWFRADFDVIYSYHAPAFGSLLLFALASVRRPPDARQHQTGTQLTRFALALLGVNFCLYPVIGWFRAEAGGIASLLEYNSLGDLLLESALGFGLVLLAMERVTVELAVANADLERVRDRLEVQATIDPLTSALNRHAFYTMFGDQTLAQGEPAGCVVVIDIDNLKKLNDTYGHAAGDRAIRTAAKIIRGAIRSDDLLFRWGGDEFLVLLFGMSEADTNQRLRSLNQQRAEYPPLPHLSWGIARFEDARGIAHAIEAADRAMYESREARRAAVGPRHRR